MKNNIIQKHSLALLSTALTGIIFTLAFVSTGKVSYSTNNMSKTLLTNSITISWEPSTKNIDGSDLTNIGGYRIYAGTNSNNYISSVDVGNSLTNVISLVGCKWYFRVSCYNSNGTMSSLTPEYVWVNPCGKRLFIKSIGVNNGLTSIGWEAYPWAIYSIYSRTNMNERWTLCGQTTNTSYLFLTSSPSCFYMIKINSFF